MNPDRLPLLVDCDGILSDITDSFLNLAAAKFNIFATRDQHTSGEFGQSIGCPALEYAVDHEVLHHEFCYRMKPIAEGLLFFKQLEATYGKENVYVCTKPWRGDARERATGEWASQRYAWLRDKLDIPSRRVIMCSAKDLVQGILIDDSVNNLALRKPGQAFCIDQPYNKEWSGPRGDYKDCLSWLEGEWYNEL